MFNPVGLSRYRPTQKSQVMETKNVSYGFSEALNLADDYRDCLAALKDDPTGSQIIIETNINGNIKGVEYGTDNVYFMVRKSKYIDKPHKSSDEYVSGDFVETDYYTVSAGFTDVDDDTRDDITKFDDMQLSENDLLGVVREIIDEHQVMDIYMDSL